MNAATNIPTNSALPRTGPDGQGSAQLAAMLDQCSHVTIPFASGLAILPHLTAQAVVANDMHDDAIHFYRTLKGVFGQSESRALTVRCGTTLNHPAERELAQSILSDSEALPGHLRAWAYWADCWLNFAGPASTQEIPGLIGLPWSARAGTNASRLRSAANGLSEWAGQFRRCDFESSCFRDLLPRVVDSSEYGIYCDLLLIGAGDVYQHSFTEVDHMDLREQLERFTEASVLLRYGDSPLVRSLYANWDIIEVARIDQSNGAAGELWIRNGPAAAIELHRIAT